MCAAGDSKGWHCLVQGQVAGGRKEGGQGV